MPGNKQPNAPDGPDLERYVHTLSRSDAASQRVLSRYCSTQTSLLMSPAQFRYLVQELHPQHRELGPTHSQHHYIGKYQNYINSTYQGSK